MRKTFEWIFLSLLGIFLCFDAGIEIDKIRQEGTPVCWNAFNFLCSIAVDKTWILKTILALFATAIVTLAFLRQRRTTIPTWLEKCILLGMLTALFTVISADYRLWTSSTLLLWLAVVLRISFPFRNEVLVWGCSSHFFLSGLTPLLAGYFQHLETPAYQIVSTLAAVSASISAVLNLRKDASKYSGAIGMSFAFYAAIEFLIIDSRSLYTFLFLLIFIWSSSAKRNTPFRSESRFSLGFLIIVAMSIVQTLAGRTGSKIFLNDPPSELCYGLIHSFSKTSFGFLDTPVPSVGLAPGCSLHVWKSVAKNLCDKIKLSGTQSTEIYYFYAYDRRAGLFTIVDSEFNFCSKSK